MLPIHVVVAPDVLRLYSEILSGISHDVLFRGDKVLLRSKLLRTSSHDTTD